MRAKYESLSLLTLRERAKARGLRGISTLKKDQLIERMLEEDKKDALKICAQAVLGSAKTILEDEDANAWALINSVCSPGGTTIAAMNKLADEGFDKTVLSAMDACVEKTYKMKM